MRTITTIQEYLSISTHEQVRVNINQESIPDNQLFSLSFLVLSYQSCSLSITIMHCANPYLKKVQIKESRITSTLFLVSTIKPEL